MTAWTDKLEAAVDTALDAKFDERDGQVVPTSDTVASNQAVKLDAVFLYADLAGSAKLSTTCPWDTTAKLIRAFLDVSTRLIRAWGGEIRSFDGDRVMGVFLGDTKNTNATQCAREIFYAVEKILGPKATKKFTSIASNEITMRCGIGIDVGTARAVRAGIRANNDLIWIGRPPSMAAKLSDLRLYPYCVCIHEDVYRKLSDSIKKDPYGNDLWEKTNFTFGGKNHGIYKCKTLKTP